MYIIVISHIPVVRAANTDEIKNRSNMLYSSRNFVSRFTAMSWLGPWSVTQTTTENNYVVVHNSRPIKTGETHIIQNASLPWNPLMMMVVVDRDGDYDVVNAVIKTEMKKRLILKLFWNVNMYIKNRSRYFKLMLFERSLCRIYTFCQNRPNGYANRCYVKIILSSYTLSTNNIVRTEYAH